MLGFFLLVNSVYPCSHVRLTSTDGMDVIGRTMELGGTSGELLRSGTDPDAPSDWSIQVHPRGEKMGGIPTCHSWTNKYGFVGFDQVVNLAGVSEHVVTDGMNEKGLTISYHTLRQSKYQEYSLEKMSLCFFDVLGYLLGNAASASEAQALLHDVVVFQPIPFPDGDLGHWAMDDSFGNHVVFEYLDGVLHWHNNTVGVMTNDPDFGWHLRNLNNYVNLSPAWPQADTPIQLDSEIGILPRVIGHGFNMGGLPGDRSPPSRFISLFFSKQYAQYNDRPSTINDAINAVTGLLAQVYIVKGTVADDPTHGDKHFEFTQYSVLKVPKQRTLFYKSYDNWQWRKISLDGLDFNKHGNMPVFDGSDGILDVTDKL